MNEMNLMIAFLERRIKGHSEPQHRQKLSNFLSKDFKMTFSMQSALALTR